MIAGIISGIKQNSKPKRRRHPPGRCCAHRQNTTLGYEPFHVSQRQMSSHGRDVLLIETCRIAFTMDRQCGSGVTAAEK
jgi:hypothetical protein